MLQPHTVSNRRLVASSLFFRPLHTKIKKMILELISAKTCQAVAELFGSMPEASAISIEFTKKEIEGDITIVVFPLLKISRKSPEATASALGAWLQEKMPEIGRFEVIKGFLNLTLSDIFWISFLNDVQNADAFGFTPTDGKAPVVVEFSSPNTNKPLHLGHIRNNLIGNAVSEILRANGNAVVKVNLVNDRGIHICKSMLAYSKWGNGETPETSGMKGDHLVGKYYVMFDQMYKKEISGLVASGSSEESAARDASLIQEAREVLRKWESRDPEVIGLWNQMNGWTYDGFEQTYRELGITFDKTYFESETYLLGKDLVMEGLQQGVLLKREDGSVWIDLRDQGLDEKLLLRSDGTSVYMTQDLGTAELRYHDFHPSEMIYVVGNEQNYHFEVLKLVLHKLGRSYSDHINHLSYGMVELPQGKMKSREGTVVDADDLMDEMFLTAETMTRELGKANAFEAEEAKHLFRTIGLGALKYFILKVDPKKNMLFDPVESIDFNGNTGPFIQYTYARIISLLTKAEEAGHAVNKLTSGSGISLLKLEKEMIVRLYQFPATVREAGTALNPALLANYIYDLAKGYNQFYQEIPILKEANRDKITLRLAISFITADLIRRSMSLLGIEVPRRM